MDGQFGDRLRALRVERGMSQTALGGSRYTPSYISHLESGRRLPTREVVGYLAATLEVPRDQLDGHSADGEHANAELLDLELDLSQAGRDGDLAGALSLAGRLRALAADWGRTEIWWRASLELSRLLALSGRLGESEQMLEALAGHDLTRRSASIAAEARNLTTSVLTQKGDIRAALRCAHDAVAVTSAMPVGSSRRVRALANLVAAQVNVGDIEEAQFQAERLAAEAPVAGSVMVAGIAAWVRAEVYLAADRSDEGAACLDSALELIDPRNDIHLWARFIRASAFRLVVTGAPARAGQHIARLEGAQPPNLEDERLMESVARAADPPGRSTQPAMADRLTSALQAVTGAPPHLRAEVLLAIARSRHDAGDVDAASVAAAEATAIFEEAGAVWRALAAMRYLRDLQSDRTPEQKH